MPPKKLKPVKKKRPNILKESLNALIQLFPYILIGSILGIAIGQSIFMLLMYLIK